MNNIEILFDKLWPIYRSLTGEGNRKTIDILSEISTIEKEEIKSGTKIFDWTIPPEYSVDEAYIADLNGNRLIDFNVNNLHLVSYSLHVDTILTFEELAERLHYIEDLPDEIPYVTSYYEDYWGFCLSFNQFKNLDKKTKYRVFIDSKKNTSGSMTIGQRFFPGKVKKEVLISTYICHPSLANNELSGPLLTIFLQKLIEDRKDRYYSYRFVYVPETIGAIYILSKHGDNFKKNLQAGLVVTCVGDSGIPTFKKSRRGDSIIDRLIINNLSREFTDFNIEDFFPTGSDERQYCSPYYNLPVASLMRTRYAKYKEYHTSADNKSIMDFEGMNTFINFYNKILIDLEYIHKYIVVDGRGEPFLRGHNLYQSLGAKKQIPQMTNIILWALNSSTGDCDTLDIAISTGSELSDVYQVCELLCDKGLLNKIK
jgi:aminopeptidase-like protein